MRTIWWEIFAFQLRFEISEIDSMEDCRNAKLPLLLDAVVQHASAKLRPNWLACTRSNLRLQCDVIISCS